MSKAIQVHGPGDASVLQLEEVSVPPPAAGEVQLRQTAIGVNFIDVYQRTGLYPLPLPFTPGQEGAGVVTVLGEGVSTLRVGQRVAYAGLIGGYAEVRNAKADRLIVLPDDVTDVTAASIMLKGMTAEALLRRVRPVGAGDSILFHAAAGGVGLIATQWAKHLGARVIGAVGSRQKISLAEPNCHHVICLSDGPWVEQVKQLGGGRGVQVAYDSIGKDTLLHSIDALAPRGMLVAFGQSSGKPPPLELSVLAARSLYLTRPTLFAYIVTRAELEESANALFDVIRSGAVKVGAPTVMPLAQAAAAHRALEGRQTSGSVVLIP